MAKTKISEFSTTPGNNTDINGINIAEGCAPSGINNAIRELMSDLKEWQSGAMDVYVIPQGTAAAPGIQLYGDLDTGLYGYAANQLGVAVGGASAGYFSSAGWVGNVNGTITGDINATTIDTTNLEVTNIKAKDGTAAITIANSTGLVTVSSELAVDNISISGNAIGSSDTNGNIFIAPNGSGDIYLAADLNIIGDGGPNVYLATSAASDLVLQTNLGTNSGSIRIEDGVNGDILIETNGTGQIKLTGDLDVANIETGAIKARDGTASATIANSTGVMTIASSVLTTTDINGGTIDGTTIGGSTAAAGTFTTVNATNVEVTNIKAKDGTAAASIANSTGVVTLSKDAVINGIAVGKGKGSEASNTALGVSALAAFTTGQSSTAIGQFALWKATQSAFNTAVGAQSQLNSLTGGRNTSVGALTLNSATTSDFNVAIGYSALNLVTGDNNTAVGSNAGSLITTGAKNTIIGNYDGNTGGLDIRTASNYIVLSDGDGNPRAYWNGADATFNGTLNATTITGTQVNSDNLRLDGNVLSATNTNGPIVLQANGTGLIFNYSDSVVIVPSGTTANLTTDTGCDLVLDTNTGTSSGSVTIQDGVNGNILIATNGTGQVQVDAPLIGLNKTATTWDNGLNVLQMGSGAVYADVVGRMTIAANSSYDGSMYTYIEDGDAARYSIVNGQHRFYTASSGLEGDEITDYTQQVTISSSGLAATTIDTTNIEVTNIKAKDGTAALSIADSTGVVSVSANPVLSGGTANGVAYLNGSKVLTTGSALTFDGTTLKSQYLNAQDFAASNDFVVGFRTNAGTQVAYLGVVSSANNLSIFSTNSLIFNANSTERMRLDASGNLLVGATATADSSRLFVSGNLGTNGSQFNFRPGSGAQYEFVNRIGAGFDFYVNNAGSLAARITSSGSLELKRASNSAQNSVVFNTTVQDALTLDSSGNLGLGVTPSAWGMSGANKAFQNLGGSLYSVNTQNIGLAQNSYYNGTNNIYVTTSAATAYFQSNGSHIWYNAASGTAGNTITFTQAMTLDASGNLGVGRTDPAGYGKLAVAGLIASVSPDGVTQSVFSAANTGQINIGGYNGSGTNYITFQAGGSTERARITSGGYFKASNNGTYNNSTGTYHEMYQSANSDAAVISAVNASFTSSVVTINASRNTTNNTFYALNYYNAGAGAYKLQIADSGTVTNATGTYGTISDAKMKTDIVDAGSQWSDIKALRFRKFKMKDDPSGLVQLGVVAQEVELTSPGLVDEHTDRDAEGNDLGTTTKSVKTSVLLMKAAVALQEAMARIEKLEAEVAALKGV